jgi:DNA-binding Xre family transcriptional regulator
LQQVKDGMESAELMQGYGISKADLLRIIGKVIKEDIETKTFQAINECHICAELNYFFIFFY